MALCLGGSPASCLGQPVVCLGPGAAAGRLRVGWKAVGRICLGFSAAVPGNHGLEDGPGSRPGAPWAGFSRDLQLVKAPTAGRAVVSDW